jgi:hypothetical protein
MARDLYELAKGSRRRSSATIASAIAKIESEIEGMDYESMSPKKMTAAIKTEIAMKQIASALRWALGDEYSEPFASDCFGEDSAGL